MHESEQISVETMTRTTENDSFTRQKCLMSAVSSSNVKICCFSLVDVAVNSALSVV